LFVYPKQTFLFFIVSLISFRTRKKTSKTEKKGKERNGMEQKKRRKIIKGEKMCLDIYFSIIIKNLTCKILNLFFV